MLAAKEGILDLRAAVGSQQEHGGDAPRRSGCPSTTRSTSPARRSWRPIRSRRPRPTRRCEVQLEAIYTVTARLANLRFVNYMR